MVFHGIELVPKQRIFLKQLGIIVGQILNPLLKSPQGGIHFVNHIIFIFLIHFNLTQILLSLNPPLIHQPVLFHGHIFNVGVDVFKREFELLFFLLELFALLGYLGELLDD